jgi:hypothetical protein
MPEVKSPGPLYKVTMTEYERGYGQRPMGVKYFTTEQEAEQFCYNYNNPPGDPDNFFRARYEKVA